MAIRISELPSWVIAESVAKVTFPGFARMRHRGEDVTPAFLSALKLVAFAACPLGIVLSGAAEPVVLVVFGERWAGMIGPLAVLGLWGAVKPIRNTIAWLLNSVGHQAVLGRISLVMLVLLVPLVHLAASRGGITEVAWVVLAESVAATLLLAWFARSRAGVPLARQWSAIAVVAVACPAAWVAARVVANATERPRRRARARAPARRRARRLPRGDPAARPAAPRPRARPGAAHGGEDGGGARLVSDVSVIVVAHDVRDEVLACLASVEEHAAPVTCELLLVDNGSTDGTAEAVAEAFPAAEVVRLPRNIGVAARNEGLRRATGRTRMFLDSDARLTPGALAELVGYLDANPRRRSRRAAPGLRGRDAPALGAPVPAGARARCMRRPPLGRFFEDSARVRRHLMADERHDVTREVEYVLGACQLFTAEAQKAAGEIDPHIFFGPDDADWCFRIRRAGLAVVYHPAATVVHAYRRTSAARPLSRIAFEQLRAFGRFQWKWRRDRADLIREGREMDARAGGGQSGMPD